VLSTFVVKFVGILPQNGEYMVKVREKKNKNPLPPNFLVTNKPEAKVFFC